MIIIGDVHGKTDAYWKILRKYNQRSIQVGDFGFSKEHEWHLKNIDSENHRINFGNHDDITYVDKPHSLNNFSFNSETDIMTVRGAYSVDQAMRTEGIDWWANEELTYNEMQQAIDFFMCYKPSIMITHDCPSEARETLFDIHERSITGTGLQVMFEAHQPKLWIFGHHHKSKNELVNGTRFICLAELEEFEL